MKKTSAIFICLALFLIAIGQALQQENLEVLLPKDIEINSWQRMDDALVFVGENLYDFINGGAEIFLEYGFNQVISQEYRYGDLTVIASIYQMKDEVAAFGIFSNNRSSRFKAIKVGNDGFQTDYAINFWQSEYYVAIESFDTGQLVSEALSKFSNFISKKVEKKADRLEFLNLLPEEGLIPESLTLVKGILGVNNTYYFSEKDIFQLKNNGVGIFADYKINNEKAKLFLVAYNTPTKAQDAFIRVKNLFSSNPDYNSLQTEHDILLWQKGETYFAAKNKDSLIGIILGNKSIESATNLLNLLK